MGSYELHAWRDAMAIGALLDEMVGAAKARSIYERIGQQEVWKYEDASEDAIADFIGRSESQRPSVVRKLPDEVTKVCFLTLAILGCVRARDLMELRDRYRELLAPGRGNRETTRGLYSFSNAVQGLVDYDWPGEVFDSMGLDDGDLDDDGDEPEVGDGREASAQTVPATGALKPVIEPPPQPPDPVKHTEVVVAMGKSEAIGAGGGTGGGAWKLQLVQEGSTTVVTAVLPKALQRDALRSYLVKMADHAWGRLPTLLVLQENQGELAKELNDAAGREVAGLMRKGVMSMACMKWSEELLRSLNRELDMVGETMVSASELAAWKMHTLSTNCADVKANWQGQRDALETWVKQILVHRGRWVGEVKVTPSTTRSVHSRSTRDLAKAKRTVTKLESTNRTPYGEALYKITRELLGWRNGERTTEQAQQASAQAWVEWRFGNSDDRNRGDFQLGFEIDELFGAGSAENDLLERGVMALMQGPFHSGSPAPTDSVSQNWRGYGAPAPLRGWFQAWWCVLEANPGAFGDTRTWMPSEHALAESVQSAMPAGVTLKLNTTLMPLERVARTGDQTWVDADTCVCQGRGGLVISWVGGSRSGGVSYDGSSIGPTTGRAGLLVVAHGATPEAVVEARNAWGKASTLLKQRLVQTDGKGKRSAPHSSLNVMSVSEGVFDDLIDTRERLALMAGRKWDAAARLVGQ